MQLRIDPDGSVRCLYAEDIPLRCLGVLTIQRASHVEPTGDGNWLADLSPVQGPLLGPFETRSMALQAEQDWLLQHWL